MTQEELNKIAKEIINNNIYLTLATSDKLPWAAPLYYCKDDDFNFYFISQMQSVHIKHLLKNPEVAIAIFDSNAPEGEGNGVQASGKAMLLESEEEIIDALKYYHTSFISCSPKDFDGSKPYRLFKVISDKFFVLDPEAEVDKRVEVFLS